MSEPTFYHQQRFLLMTLDPVHIGTGGYRLGRVDLSIVREPGTRLPKIPGTSLSGAVRQFAAMRYESRRCAGAGMGEGEKSHCRDPQCPVCYTFGYIRGSEGGQSGTVSIGDARLLLFPVYSLAGPAWVTCPGVLQEFGSAAQVGDDAVKVASGLANYQHLNLGWLMLPVEQGSFDLPDAVPAEIQARAVLASDKVVSQVVNSNLEVRTSVSIDPATGAAKEGALFTYEALPRAALLWLDVIEDDFGPGGRTFPVTDKKCKVEKTTDETGAEKKRYIHNAGESLGETWSRPLDVVRAGLKLTEHLGIGGMGTRGFGRVKLTGDWEVPL
jgi:CRISPR-associated protein Cmr4